MLIETSGMAGQVALEKTEVLLLACLVFDVCAQIADCLADNVDPANADIKQSTT